MSLNFPGNFSFQTIKTNFPTFTDDIIYHLDKANEFIQTSQTGLYDLLKSYYDYSSLNLMYYLNGTSFEQPPYNCTLPPLTNSSIAIPMKKIRSKFYGFMVKNRKGGNVPDK